VLDGSKLEPLRAILHQEPRTFGQAHKHYRRTDS
jgi:hypothetical protein